MKKKSVNLCKLSVAKKSALIFMMASFVSQAMHMFTTPIFTRIMTLSEYGVCTLFNSWLAILGMLAMLSLSSGVFNVGMNDFKEDRDNFIYNMMLLSNVATIVVMAVVMAAKVLGWDFTTLSWSILALMLLYFILSPAYNFWLARQRYEYQYKKSAVVTLLVVFGGALLSVLLVIFGSKNRSSLKLWGTYIPVLAVGLGLYWHYFKKIHHINLSYWKFALCFNVPLLLHYLALNIMTGSDRIMISSMIDAEKAAIYGLSYSVASVITICWTAINGSLTPYMFECLNDGDIKSMDKTVEKVSFLYLFGCVSFMFFAPELMRVFATDKYHEGVYIIPVIVGACFFQGIYYIFVNVCFYYKSTISVMIISVLAALANIILNYFGIKIFGYQAAAYTTMITNMLMCILHYINVAHICEKKIFRIKPFIGMGGICLVSVITVKYVFDYTIIKIIALFILAVFIYVKRDAVTDYIKR